MIYSEVDFPVVQGLGASGLWDPKPSKYSYSSMCVQSSILEVMKVLDFLSEMKGKRKCGIISKDK
jgi:hypothetical protein